MKRKVPEEVQKMTTRCPNAFACLEGNGCKGDSCKGDSCNGNGCPKCKVERFISDKYLFVESDPKRVCPYRIGFGFASHVCACPVRNALYSDYEI